MSTKIASLYAEISADTTKLNAGLKQTQSALSGAQNHINGFLKAAGLLTGVAVAAGEVYKNTAGEFVNYANQVRNITLVSGESAEATSRLVQVADDYKISSTDLMTAQRMLAKEGYSLNIETMAKLSDEFLKLNTGAERSAFLTENLGRSGAVFAEMLNQGSAAILARANAVQAGLVLDQRALDSARQYEIALDDMNDQISALKVTAGNAIVPFVTQLVTTTNQIGAIREATGSWGATWNMVFEGMELDAARAEEAIKRLHKLLRQQGGSSRITTFAELDTLPETVRYIGASSEAITANYTAMAKYYEEVDKAAQQAANIAQYEPPPPPSEEALRGFQDLVSFSGDYMTLQDQIAAKEAEIAQKRAQGYSETGRTITGLTSELGALQTQQEQFMNQFVLQMLMMSGAPVESLMAVAQSMGMISDEAVKAYNDAIMLSDAIANIPASQLKTFEFYVKVTGDVEQAMVIAQQSSGAAFTGAGAGQVGMQAQASGGPASGVFLTGDAPGGWTPYTEAVYAPGGAYVFNAQQTRAMFGNSKIRGYATGAAQMDDAALLTGIIGRRPPPVSGGVWRGTGQNKADYTYSDSGAAIVETITQTVTEATTSTVVAPVVETVAAVAIATQQATAQTAALANQLSDQSVQQIALLESINAQLANMPTDIRDGFQQVVQ